MVKLGFIATVLSLISCSSDFPPAPEFEFCRLSDGKCMSVHVFSKSDCDAVGGEIVNTCEQEKIEAD
jgi:hypothetical protein